jgi:hypothetical protein
MATEVEKGIAECRAELEAAALKHEGLRDFTGISLVDSSKGAVKSRLKARDRRTELIKAHIASGEALIADGYPEMPITRLDPAAYADLKANAESILAALSEFSGDALDDLGLVAGPAIPKT